MATATVSRSDEIKEEVLLKIAVNGGSVSGDWGKIHEQVGLDVSKNVLRSALWKLVDDRKLRFMRHRDSEGCDPRFPGRVVSRTYRLAT